jgi:hypothetical protein
MIIIDNGEITHIDDRYRETCRACGAMGYGNATCSACVRQWPRFGMKDIERLLKAIGDKPPVDPL